MALDDLLHFYPQLLLFCITNQVLRVGSPSFLQKTLTSGWSFGVTSNCYNVFLEYGRILQILPEDLFNIVSE